MNLMPDEKVVLESEGKRLILTTHRIRYQVQAIGSAEITSIMLEEVASCAVVRSSNTIFLLLAGASLILGVLGAVSAGSDGEVVSIAGVICAGVFAIAYLASLKQVLAVRSAATGILIDARGMKSEAERFIDKLEEAKNARYLLGRS